MSEQNTQAADYDPFSLEEAYKTYQNNIRKSDQLIYDITKGARGDVSEHDLLLMAVEAIARMTDNTALVQVVTQALAERSANSPAESVPEQSGGSEKEVPGA